MKRSIIDPASFCCKAASIWEKQWFLLAAGEFPANFNVMTVGWGAFGTMWAKPFAMIVVRPQRYTIDFLEKYPTFTLSAFPAEYQKALTFCGRNSGRDCDKIKTTGLTPEKAVKAAAPAFVEAELVIECRKIYSDRLHKEAFLNPDDLTKNYPAGDLHQVYFGEITAITAINKYKEEK